MVSAIARERKIFWTNLNAPILTGTSYPVCGEPQTTRIQKLAYRNFTEIKFCSKFRKMVAVCERN